MRGARTLAETEHAVGQHLAGLPLDLGALVAVQNLHRAAAAVRRHLEQAALREADLSWTGFRVLVVLHDGRASESRTIAAQVGVTRATLSGVAATLERRGLLTRRPDEHDRRLAIFAPTPAGRRLVEDLYPRVTAEEAAAVSCLELYEKDLLADLLARVAANLPAAD